MIIIKRKQSTAVKNEYLLAVIYRKLYDESNDGYSNFGYKGRSIFLYLTHGPHPTSIYYSDLFKFQKYSNIILCKLNGKTFWTSQFNLVRKFSIHENVKRVGPLATSLH